MELGLGLTKIIPLVVYFTAIVVIFLTLFYKIEAGIYFLIPLLPLQNILEHITQYPGGKDILDILFLTLIIKWAVNRNKVNPNHPLQRPVLLLVIAISMWTYLELWRGASFLGSGSPLSFSDIRFKQWKNFIMLPILYLIIIKNVKDKKQIKILFMIMTVTMLFMDRNFYHNIQFKDMSHFSYDLRISGTFSYLGPNELAVFYAQNTIILLSLVLMQKNIRRNILLTVTIIFNYYCLVFLYSRGGYLATLVSWMFLGLVKDRRVLLVLIVFLIFWRALVPLSVQERIDMTRTEEGTDSSVEVRYRLWQEAKEVILSNPVLGVGYGVIPFLDFQVGHHRNSLHNGYIEVLLEQGVIGLLIFLWFFFISIRYGWRLFRTVDEGFFKGLGLGFVGCVLAVLAGNIAGSYWFYLNVSAFFWVNLALVVRSLEIFHEEQAGMNSTKKASSPLRSPRLITAV